MKRWKPCYVQNTGVKFYDELWQSNKEPTTKLSKYAGGNIKSNRMACSNRGENKGCVFKNVAKINIRKNLYIATPKIINYIL